MKEAVAGELAAAYHSALVDEVTADDYRTTTGPADRPPRARVRLLLRRRSRRRLRLPGARSAFPIARVFLTGEIIHNPHVNDRLRAQGIRFLTRSRRDAATRSAPDDVVILPAFGVTGRRCWRAARAPRLHAGRHDLRLGAERLEERRAATRRTASPSIIHGKVKHEETRATASQALKFPRRPLPRRARSRRGRASSATTSATAAIATAFLARFARRGLARLRSRRAISQRIGCANQTTMLMSESLEIGEMFRAAMRDRYGEAELADALPRLRHDLQRDAGAAGRRRRAARRASRST